MERKYKIIVAHPGKQHSYQTAVGLKKSGYLFKYATTVYQKKNSFTSLLSRTLKGKDKIKANSHRCEMLDDGDVIQFNEIGALITLCLSRIPKLNWLYLRWNLLVANSFYKKVMKYAKKENVDMVIVYDGYSEKHYDIIQKTNIIKIMDVSMADRHYLRKIFEEDMERFGSYELKEAHPDCFNSKWLDVDMRNLISSDYYFVASSFVEDSLVYCGISKDKIVRIPYGVDLDKFYPSSDARSMDDGYLHLIYVGQINYRKGLHHLLEAVKKFKNSVKLVLCGNFDETNPLVRRYSSLDNVSFLGFVNHDDLSREYSKADAFILPSLGEGMAMVGLEAMACALPVVCTFNTGLGDLIEDGQSGLIIQDCSPESIEKSIQWLINNKTKLPQMGELARSIAKEHSWNDYHDSLGRAVDTIMKG